MEFKHPKGKPEKEGAQRCVKEMRKHGWKCHRLNVSAGEFSTTGFPDYYCTHLKFGSRWIEFKQPNGRLEPSQVERFRDFAEHGIGVWVMHDENDYQLLFEKPNWWKWTWKGLIR